MQRKFGFSKGLSKKDYGNMRDGFDLLEATRRMDKFAIEFCLSVDPDSIHDTDAHENNALHICVAGFTSIRAPELIPFFLEKTNINLLHKNKFGCDPLDTAISLNDQAACELIEPYWNKQFCEKYPWNETEEEASQAFIPPHNTSPDPSLE